MGLAEPHAAVQEQRVVRMAGTLRDREARGVGEAVRGADDEVREGVASVDVAGAALAADARGLDAHLGRWHGRARVAHRRRGGGDGSRRRARAHCHADRVVPIARVTSVDRFLRATISAARWGVGDPDDEVNLDAVAHDPAEGLGDQRAVAALKPVLREAVRDRDPEAGVIDLDERGVAQPCLEVGGREGDLELAEGRAPDLLGIHGSMETLVRGDATAEPRGRAGEGRERRE